MVLKSALLVAVDILVRPGQRKTDWAILVSVTSLSISAKSEVEVTLSRILDSLKYLKVAEWLAT